MDFASIRMITDDLEPAVQFYERVTGIPAARPAPVFAELHLPPCTIAFGHAQTAQLFRNAARPADNHALGEPLHPVHRSRRQPRRSLHPRHRGSHQEVQQLIART